MLGRTKGFFFFLLISCSSAPIRENTPEVEDESQQAFFFLSEKTDSVRKAVSSAHCSEYKNLQISRCLIPKPKVPDLGEIQNEGLPEFDTASPGVPVRGEALESVDFALRISWEQIGLRIPLPDHPLIGVIDGDVELHHPVFEGVTVEYRNFLSARSEGSFDDQGQKILSILAGGRFMDEPVGILPYTKIRYAQWRQGQRRSLNSFFHALEWMNNAAEFDRPLVISLPEMPLRHPVLARALERTLANDIALVAPACPASESCTYSDVPALIRTAAYFEKPQTNRASRGKRDIDFVAPATGFIAAGLNEGMAYESDYQHVRDIYAVPHLSVMVGLFRQRYPEVSAEEVLPRLREQMKTRKRKFHPLQGYGLLKYSDVDKPTE